jgi:ABC-type uncharacterized transport system fused permease/ATPase subunit
MTTEPVVEVENLRVRFAGAEDPAVDGISFSIAAGECLALVGESGSGKSVTARSLIDSGWEVGTSPGSTGAHSKSFAVPLWAPSARTRLSPSILFGLWDGRWMTRCGSTQA